MVGEIDSDGARTEKIIAYIHNITKQFHKTLGK